MTFDPHAISRLRLHVGRPVSQFDGPRIRSSVKFDGARNSEWIDLNEITTLPESAQIVRELAVAKSCY